MNNYQGWLNVYKPTNITSFGVLKKIKKNFYINKIGHAGTLDPLAEGKGKWVVSNDRLSHWLSVGAEPSDRVITFLMAEGLGSDRQRKKWQAAIDRRKALYASRKAEADAKKAAEAKKKKEKDKAK